MLSHASLNLLTNTFFTTCLNKKSRTFDLRFWQFYHIENLNSFRSYVCVMTGADFLLRLSTLLLLHPLQNEPLQALEAAAYSLYACLKCCHRKDHRCALLSVTTHQLDQKPIRPEPLATFMCTHARRITCMHSYPHAVSRACSLSIGAWNKARVYI